MSDPESIELDAAYGTAMAEEEEAQRQAVIENLEKDLYWQQQDKKDSAANARKVKRARATTQAKNVRVLNKKMLRAGKTTKEILEVAKNKFGIGKTTFYDYLNNKY